MKYLAKFLGAIANWFFRWADKLDPEYDEEWNRIRDAVRRRYAELDNGWEDCNLPTMPCPPRLPAEEDEDRASTVPRIELPPPAPPYRPERREYYAGGRCESIHPPAGTFWVGALLNRRSDPPPKGQA